MEIFDKRDNEYLNWLDNNPSSFVVNTHQTNNSNYFGAYTEMQYIKIVSDNLSELKKWLNRNLELITELKKYDEKGDYRVMLKAIDIFGNDTTYIIELQHR